MLCAAAALVFASVTAALAAEPATQDKRDLPVVVTHLVLEDSDGAWHDEADFAQGQDIPFRVAATLPEDLPSRGACPYWLQVRTDPAFAMVGGSIGVQLRHADGSYVDVTPGLSVSFDGRTVTAGSADIASAVPGVSADDTVELYYTMRFADAYSYGFRNGNSNYAWLRYDGASYADGAAARGEGLKPSPGAAAKAASRTRVPALPWPAGPAAAFAAEPGPDASLASSPEVKVTAYTYCVDLVKVAEGHDRRLSGASFAVSDGDGRWYVRGSDWAASRDDATVFTTDAEGRVLVKGLDADAYELVEVEAPPHYLPAGPVDVLIESDVAGQGDAMRVTSAAARVEKATAADGTALVEIGDPVDPDDPDPALPGGPGGPRDPRTVGAAGLLAQLGDTLPLAGAAALAAAAVAALAMATSRRRGGHEDVNVGGKAPVDGMRFGARERKENG